MKLTKSKLKEIIREELLNEKYDFNKLAVDLRNARKVIVNITKKAQKSGIPGEQIYSLLINTGKWLEEWMKGIKR